MYWLPIQNWREFWEALPVWIDKKMVALRYRGKDKHTIELGFPDAIPDTRLELPKAEEYGRVFDPKAGFRWMSKFNLTTVRATINRYGGSERNYVCRIGDTYYTIKKPFVLNGSTRLYVTEDELEFLNILDREWSYVFEDYLRYLRKKYNPSQERRVGQETGNATPEPRRFGL